MKFDVIVIGGGLAGITAAFDLQFNDYKCAVISEGLSLSKADSKDFVDYGGTVIPGDRVCDAEFEGGLLKSVRTEKLGDVSLEADNFILATGKFFSKGLVADMDKVYEPIFGLDVHYDPDRGNWFKGSFAAHQPFLDFGVETDEAGHAILGGEPVPNLYAAGEILKGISGAEQDATEIIKESALKAAQQIRK